MNEKQFPSIQEVERRRHLTDASISELCRRAGVAESLYHRWRRKTVAPSLVSLKKLYKALDGLERA